MVADRHDEPFVQVTREGRLDVGTAPKNFAFLTSPCPPFFPQTDGYAVGAELFFTALRLPLVINPLTERFKLCRVLLTIASLYHEVLRREAVGERVHAGHALPRGCARARRKPSIPAIRCDLSLTRY